MIYAAVALNVLVVFVDFTPDDDCDVGLGAGSDASASGLSHVIGPLGFVNTLYRSDPHSSVDAV